MMLNAQNVQWQYYNYHHAPLNEDKAYAITETSDGGYVFAGRYGTNGYGNADLYFAKLNAAGSPVWFKVYSGTSGDEAKAIKQLSDGSFIVAGYTWDFGTPSGTYYKSILIKLNPTGDTVWTKRFYSQGILAPDGLGCSVDTTDDGGFVLAGKFANGANGNDFFIVKTNANGDSLWARKYGGSGSDIPRVVRKTTDGGFIIAGTTKSFGTNTAFGNIWLVKTNSTGDTTWTRVIGSTDAEECYSINETTDDGYILTGRKGNDIYVVKTDRDGFQQWEKTYPHAGPNDVGRDIIQTSDGGYALAGLRTATHGYYLLFPQLMYVLKMDKNGIKEWEKELGYDNSPNGSGGYCIRETSDKGLIVAGFNQPDTAAGGSEDIRAFIVKFSPLVYTGEKNIYTVTDCRVSPNPFTETAVVNLPENLTGEKQFDLYDISGRIIWNSRINEEEKQISLNRNHLSPGIYFYELRSDLKQSPYRGKIIVR